MPYISTENNNNNVFFFYFFISFYIICVSFLIYTFIRLFKYYLRQRQMNSIYNEIINHPSLTTTAFILKIHNINEDDSIPMKNEFDFLQPIIIETQDLPPSYIETSPNQPPRYKEHL